MKTLFIKNTNSQLEKILDNLAEKKIDADEAKKQIALIIRQEKK